MIGLLISAGIMILVLAAMEDDYPDWLTAILCVVATAAPSIIVRAIMPDLFFFIGPIVGAIVGGVVISATFGMSLKRACIAAAVYLACTSVISFVF